MKYGTDYIFDSVRLDSYRGAHVDLLTSRAVVLIQDVVNLRKDNGNKDGRFILRVEFVEKETE